VTDADIAILNSSWPMGSPETYPDHVHLRATNKDVNAYNDMRLSRLPGECVTFRCVDTILVRHHARQEYAMNRIQTVARGVIDIKVGAQVVLTRSIGNVKAGARGRVEVITADVSVSCSFDGVPEPVVVERAVFEVKDAVEDVLAKREQLPLLLAWAVTISRAQGMSLSLVAVDFSLTRWTLDGLVYSALSRASGMSGLRVRGLTRAHIMCSGSALGFYRSLLAAHSLS